MVPAGSEISLADKGRLPEGGKGSLVFGIAAAAPVAGRRATLHWRSDSGRTARGARSSAPAVLVPQPTWRGRPGWKASVEWHDSWLGASHGRSVPGAVGRLRLGRIVVGLFLQQYGFSLHCRPDQDRSGNGPIGPGPRCSDGALIRLHINYISQDRATGANVWAFYAYAGDRPHCDVRPYNDGAVPPSVAEDHTAPASSPFCLSRAGIGVWVGLFFCAEIAEFMRSQRFPGSARRGFRAATRLGAFARLRGLVLSRGCAAWCFRAAARLGAFVRLRGLLARRRRCDPRRAAGEQGAANASLRSHNLCDLCA
jgi:hypothetical protein